MNNKIESTYGLYPNTARDIALNSMSSLSEGSVISIIHPKISYAEYYKVLDKNNITDINEQYALIPVSYYLDTSLTPDPMQAIDNYFADRNIKKQKRKPPKLDS